MVNTNSGEKVMVNLFHYLYCPCILSEVDNVVSFM